MSFFRNLCILSLFPFLVSWSFPSGITEIKVFDGNLLLPPQSGQAWPDETPVKKEVSGWIVLSTQNSFLKSPEKP
ncbi:MAG: hypothetical protein HKM06_09265 [Spirochaetales bacterium]|nr:hypothetical protein [Spirochaetales bacterium]